MIPGIRHQASGIRLICGLFLALTLASCNSTPSTASVTTPSEAFETFSDGQQLSLTNSVSLQSQGQLQNQSVAKEIEQRPLIRHTFSNDMKITFENKNGNAIREGDIVVMPSRDMPEMILNYEKYIAENDKKVNAQAAGRTWTCYAWFIACWNSIDARWPNRAAYYEIDSSFSASETANLRFWIRDFANATSITWFENSAVNDRVRFIKPADASLCNSRVGRAGGIQILNLGSNCLTKSVVHHEMGHAVGLEHEQTRCDRDNFVRVNYGNIVSDKVSNFDKYCDSQHRDLGVYDYDSLMHYGAYFFSANTLPTISGLNPPNGAHTGSPLNFGNSSNLSPGDIAGINSLYQ